MPKLKTGTILPTPEEDAVITAAAMSDADAMPLSDEQWAVARSKARIGRREAQRNSPPEEGWTPKADGVVEIFPFHKRGINKANEV